MDAAHAFDGSGRPSTTPFDDDGALGAVRRKTVAGLHQGGAPLFLARERQQLSIKVCCGPISRDTREVGGASREAARTKSLRRVVVVELQEIDFDHWGRLEDVMTQVERVRNAKLLDTIKTKLKMTENY